MDPVLYEKCKHCHLFIEANEVTGEGIALWVHLHRGDDADEAIEESHDAEPSGQKATLETWKEFGPEAMRLRFDPLPEALLVVVGGEHRLKCPNCHALQVCEVNKAVDWTRSLRIDIDGATGAITWDGDFSTGNDWEGDGYVCAHCFSRLELPSNIDFDHNYE